MNNPTQSSQPSVSVEKHPPQLPLEILLLIVSFIPPGPQSQSTLHALTLVSRLWYSAAIADLYRSPDIHGSRFNQFVPSICPSINARVKKNGLGDLVVRLDMSNLVHESSKSVTARLLGRLKGGLREFVAPQASFAVNSLAALSKCGHLRILDLSRVSESLKATALFRATRKLEHLETFHFPRSSLLPPSPLTDFSICPNNVRHMYITGVLKLPTSAYHYLRWPSSLTHLSIRGGDAVSQERFSLMLEALGPQLKYLKLENFRGVQPYAIEDLLYQLPVIHTLNISTTYMGFALTSRRLFEPKLSPSSLVKLKLSCRRPGLDDTWDWIWSCVMGKVMPNLRIVNVPRRMGWKVDEDTIIKIMGLHDLFKGLAREDGGATGVDESTAGVQHLEDFTTNLPPIKIGV